MYRDFCLLCQIDHTEFSSLSSDGEFECIEVHILPIQCCELRDTQSCRVDTLRDRIISFSLDSLSRYCLKKSLYLFTCQKSNLSIQYSHEIEGRRIETVNLFFFQIFEPRSDSDDMSIDRLHGESTICEREPPGIKILFFDIFYFWFWIQFCELNEGGFPIFYCIFIDWWEE